MGLREGKILAIERWWIKKREDGYWLCLPPAASRIKGNPKEVPLNHIALRALAEDLPSLTEGRVFRRCTNARAFKGYWLETIRRVGIADRHQNRYRTATKTATKKNLHSCRRRDLIFGFNDDASFIVFGPKSEGEIE